MSHVLLHKTALFCMAISLAAVSHIPQTHAQEFEKAVEYAYPDLPVWTLKRDENGVSLSPFVDFARDLFKEVGVPTKVVPKSRTTELGKLLDTTYYGVCIAFHQYAKDLCDREGLDFEAVMTDFNRTYNIGVLGLDRPQFVRPVLYPPEGPIGGHCVVTNKELLEAQYGPDLILSGIK